MNTGKTEINREISRLVQDSQISAKAVGCRRKFLRFFPKGFQDEKYIAWERGYKWQAHEKWDEMLNQAQYQSLLRNKDFGEIARRAVKIESPTNLIFSFEKLALRDAVKTTEGAQIFAEGLFDFLYGEGKPKQKFEPWLSAVGRLPKKQSRVLTYPIVTVFGFIAQPEKHIFLKPKVTQTAAREYGFDFQYQSKVSQETYAGLLEFADQIKSDLKDLKPRDMIDIQSFIWVQGSSEYEE